MVQLLHGRVHGRRVVRQHLVHGGTRVLRLHGGGASVHGRGRVHGGRASVHGLRRRGRVCGGTRHRVMGRRGRVRRGGGGDGGSGASSLESLQEGRTR